MIQKKLSFKSKLFLFSSIFSIFVFSNITFANLAKVVTSPFYYDFRVDGAVNETGLMDDSTSPYWWLNSGGQFLLSGGLGMTLQGDLAVGSYWQKYYKIDNTIDTDGGIHPQNLFRLLTRSKWLSFEQQIDFKINKYNLSASTERYNPNGFLLFNRYLDGNNLYYTGVRVDGDVVIKKKIKGSYYTLAEKKFFTGTYNRTTNPNLIPLSTWIKMKSRIVTNTNGTVTISLFLDSTNSGIWTKVLEVVDDGKTFGGVVINSSGYAGIRTDFMDTAFDNYRITNI